MEHRDNGGESAQNKYGWGGKREESPQTPLLAGVRSLLLQLPSRCVWLLGYCQRQILIVDDVAIHAGSSHLNVVGAHCGTDL